VVCSPFSGRPSISGTVHLPVSNLRVGMRIKVLTGFVCLGWVGVGLGYFAELFAVVNGN
jgi:hypothetical protein